MKLFKKFQKCTTGFYYNIFQGHIWNTDMRSKCASKMENIFCEHYDMILEYIMIEPCHTFLKFFEKFHRTVVQISFLGDHV